MLISKENHKKICQYLFQEGVMVAKKDFNAPKHQDLDVPNLEVIKAMQSFNSRGYVTTRFSWQYYYYYLTDAGIEYLREYLHLPPEIVPTTFIKTNKTGTRPGARGPEDRSQKQRPDSEYRRAAPSDEKKETAGADFKPDFRGGVGRGGPRPQ